MALKKLLAIKQQFMSVLKLFIHLMIMENEYFYLSIDKL